MAERDLPLEAEEEAPPPPRRRWARRLALVLLAIFALLLAALAGIDSGPGHRLIADRVAALRPPTGLRIRIGRIDGSIWHRATLRDIRLYDPHGLFFEAPEIALDWHPLRWLHNRLDIDRLAAPLVRLDRLPQLRDTGRTGPVLPGFDIRIGALAIDRLALGRAVAGHAERARVRARADISGGRAMIGLRMATSAGDRLLLDLDARPDGDRFGLAAALRGPGNGVFAGLAGIHQPIRLDAGGRGTWTAWDGTARGMLNDRPIADLALRVRGGRYGLSGMLAPAPFLQGKLQRLTAPVVRVEGKATLQDRQLAGQLTLVSRALRLGVHGGVDLAASAFRGLRVETLLAEPHALFPNMTGRDVRLHLRLDGPFRTAAFTYALAAPHLQFDDTGFDAVRAVGAGRFGGVPVAVPIRLHAARVTGLGDVAGGILANLGVAGVLHVDAKVLQGSDLALTSDKLKGKLALRVDLVTGRYDVGVTGGLQRYLIPGLGIVSVTSRVSVVPGPGDRGTMVAGTGQAVVERFDNAFLRSLAGGNPRIDTRLVRTPDGVLHFSDLVLTAPAIRITGAGLRRRDGSFQFAGIGRQATYGSFRITLDGMIDHPTVRLVLDRPLDALDLAQVALDLDPVAEGFQFRTGGRSALGRFTGHGLIHSPPNAATTIEVSDLAVTHTHARGLLRSDPQGFTGSLALGGGGIAGTIGFAPQGTIQRIDPHLTFTAARIEAATPVTVRRGAFEGSILLDPAGTTLDGNASGLGIAGGGASLARASASAHLRGGRGTVGLKLAGSRGRAFDVTGLLNLAPGRVALTGGGTIDGKPVRLPGPAVLTTTPAGWALAPARLDYAGGSLLLSGSGGGGATAFDAKMEYVPLGVLDILNPTLGFGGVASGTLSARQATGGPPTGRLDVTVRGLSRSGTVLTSRPADVALAAVLTANGAAARAVAMSGGATIGRMQAKVGPLGVGGDLLTRFTAAPLFAQLRYNGPADTPWRLLGVETIDLSGPLGISADVGGTLARPQIRGRVTSDGGRLESSVTGTVVTAVKASGRFDGSRLLLDQLTGRAGGGTVTGKGSFTFAAGQGGLGIDLAIQAQDAALLARDDIGATITGPLTIRSTGSGGTIGGNLAIERGRFRLGSTAAAQVPHLAVTELNRPDEGATDAAPTASWRLDLKARARNQLMVTGLGLDSEWRADLTIRGAVDDPAIGGRVDLVRGGYQFAGRRFDLDRGTIRFTGEAPPDPTLDITALANVEGLNATIHVAGTGLHPDIHFASVPALPEDELLARLLFGTSIANLSAPEALQLAAAVASLRGGGGGGFNLDPINAVRKAVKLDRLRILPADPTTGQKTAVAAGKYIGRRTYVEVVTDGQGYSASSVEYRITRWLSVLSTISTVGRQSANVKVSKDY